MSPENTLTFRQAFALLFVVAGGIMVLLAQLGVPGVAPARGLALGLAITAGALMIPWSVRTKTKPARPPIARATWLSLPSARSVLLANAAEARDRWAVVSSRHLDRIRPDVVGGLIYSPDDHLVVMVWRGTQVSLVPPTPLSVFGLEAPRPLHLLRKDELFRVRGQLATMKGVWS